MNERDLTSAQNAIIARRAAYAFELIASPRADRDTWIATVKKDLTERLTPGNLAQELDNYEALNRVNDRQSREGTLRSFRVTYG